MQQQESPRIVRAFFKVKAQKLQLSSFGGVATLESGSG
jgi:hypothetical protein